MSILLPIPPIETATDPITSPADLRERWRALMGPLGFGQRLLWIGVVGSDRCMVKALTQAPLDRVPDRRAVLELMAMLSDLLADYRDGTTLAVLLSRPGGEPRPTAGDRRWAEVLTETARRVGVPIEPIFLANDLAIHPL